MISLDLTESQFSRLLELVYLGEWVRQAHNKDTYDTEIENLEQLLYRTAYQEGLDEMVEYDKKLGGYVPSEEFEEACDEYIEQYDSQTFWEELIVRLAQKKLDSLHGSTLSSKEAEKQQAIYITEYEKEFEINGIERLDIKQ